MTAIQVQPPFIYQNNNPTPITTNVASEFLQVSSNGLVFEDQQRNPGVFVGNLH